MTPPQRVALVPDPALRDGDRRRRRRPVRDGLGARHLDIQRRRLREVPDRRSEHLRRAVHDRHLSVAQPDRAALDHARAAVPDHRRPRRGRPDRRSRARVRDRPTRLVARSVPAPLVPPAGGADPRLVFAARARDRDCRREPDASPLPDDRPRPVVRGVPSAGLLVGVQALLVASIALAFGSILGRAFRRSSSRSSSSAGSRRGRQGRARAADQRGRRENAQTYQYTDANLSSTTGSSSMTARPHLGAGVCRSAPRAVRTASTRRPYPIVSSSTSRNRAITSRAPARLLALTGLAAVFVRIATVAVVRRRPR